MDVRCEKCGTEYELDEARLKPTGVTVKCTNCGHMFKIRRRPTTNVSTPPVAGTAERVWMIRLENGESKTCRELGTLQQWIVAGLVTRDSMISRSGKTWKKLGEIPELASFFAAAAGVEISRAAASQSIPLELTAVPAPAPTGKADPKVPNNATMMGLGVSAVPSADASYPDTTPTNVGASAAALPVASRDDSQARIATTAATAEDYASIQDIPHSPSGLHRRPPTQPPPPPGSRRPATQPPPPPPGRGDSAVAKLPVPQRSTAAWASDAIKQVNQHHDHDDDAGPSSGSLRAAAPEPKFAGSLRSGPTRESSFSGAPAFRMPSSADVGDDAGASMQLAPSRGSRAGLWIALGSLLVIGGAAAAVYVLVFRAPKSPAPTPAIAAASSDAGMAPTPTVDAATTPSTSPTDPLAKSRAAILEGVTSRLHAADQALASRPDGGAVSALRARIGLALAQNLDNQATLLAATDKSKADLVERDAKQQVLDVVKLAQHSLKDAPTDPQANLAMADILRMQGKPVKDINKYLDAATAGGAADASNVAREVALIRAMTDLRDGKHDLALTELGNLDGAESPANGLEKTGDVRPRLQRALILLTDGKRDDAQTLIQSILATVPDHDIARAAAERIEALITSGPSTTVTPIAAPPEAGTPAAPGTQPVAGAPTVAAAPVTTEDYNKLIAKGNELAEVSCGQAMPYFEKALAANPAGIEALTGMGFCHIDAKQFASAYSKFRAALAISPHYERALWGTAEAYQQQGLKDQAIEAYRTYLAAFPNSAAAKKQLDRLGGNDSGNTAPATPTPPTVAPASGNPPPVASPPVAAPPVAAPPVAAPPPVATPPKPADSDSPKSDPQ